MIFLKPGDKVIRLPEHHNKILNGLTIYTVESIKTPDVITLVGIPGPSWFREYFRHASPEELEYENFPNKLVDILK